MQIRSALFATLALAWSGTPLPAADAPPMPRYRLATGQEIGYRSETESKRDGGETTSYQVDWKFWVLDRDAEGAYRLVIRCDLATRSVRPGAKAEEPDPVDTIVWRCRLFDDGRLIGATSRGTVRDPSRIFPKLPDGPTAIADGWEAAGARDEQARLHYRVAARPTPEQPTWTIVSRCTSPEQTVYALEDETRATFDPARGFATRVETDNASRYGIKAVTKGAIELVAIEPRGEEWAARFGRDADAYFRAVEAYEAGTTRAARDAARCKEILADAKAHLGAARDAVEAPFLKEALATKLAGHDRWFRGMPEEAERRARFLGKPAPDWEAKDVDGQPRRLADLRGRVVVMDFWYRGCGWCMTAMPQVKHLAQAFADRPVTVLGMSIDKDPEDARVVIDAMKLNYPTIRAEGIPERFEVTGYPTLIVVDPKGIVREFHVGYSPHLFDELSGLIGGLLAEKP